MRACHVGFAFYEPHPERVYRKSVEVQRKGNGVPVNLHNLQVGLSVDCFSVHQSTVILRVKTHHTEGVIADIFLPAGINLEQKRQRYRPPNREAYEFAAPQNRCLFCRKSLQKESCVVHCGLVDSTSKTQVDVSEHFCIQAPSSGQRPLRSVQARGTGKESFRPCARI